MYLGPLLFFAATAAAGAKTGRFLKKITGIRSSGKYLMELLLGFEAMACVIGFGVSGRVLWAAAVCWTVTVVSFIDIDLMIIPDKANILLAVLGISSVFFFGEISVAERLLGALIISVPMILMDLAARDSFGGGDIKLMSAAGLFLGWEQTVVAAIVGFLAGGAYGGIMTAVKGKSQKQFFALGPFLSGGIIVALWGLR